MPRRRPRIHRGRNRLERERHRLPPEYVPVGGEPARPIEDLLPRAMKDLGAEQSYWMRRLEEQWTELAGPSISRVARPGAYAGRVLTIYVTHSTWLSELQRYSGTMLLNKLQEVFGKDAIASIRFRIDPDGAGYGTADPRR